MAGIRPILILLTGIGIGMLAPQLSLNEVKPVWTPATECYCPQTPNESTAAVEKLEKPEEVKETPPPTNTEAIASDAGSSTATLAEVPTSGKEEVQLTVDQILAHAQRLEPQIQLVRLAMENNAPICDMPPNDGVALLTVSDLAGTEVILESGTANGRSTEMMARFFQRQRPAVQITTVDLGEKQGGHCAARLAETHKRLRKFQNVRALIGDSFKEFPKLILQHRGKRIGLFIDGPKGELAVKLCMKMLKFSSDVVYCLFHDFLPDGFDWGTKDHKGFHYLQRWGRNLMVTCCDPKWLKHFNLPYALNSSIGLAVGTAVIPWGIKEAQVAVVVDTFAEARERDVLNLAEEMERNHENDKKFLQKVFERIDEDGSGELTLEELVEGARQDPEFQSRLRVMDIDEVDLQQLFEMIDVDGSGSIEAHEFIAPLSRWVHESKTAPRFIKYNMLRSMQQQDELYRQSWYQFNALSTKLEELSSTVDHLAHRGPSESVAPSVPSEMSSPEEASPNHRSSRRSSRPSRMSDRTASLDEVEGMMSPQEKAEDVASEHPEGPAEQPQASSLMFDWRPGPRPARNRLGSEEGHFVRKHSLEQIHENQRSSSASTGPGASAVGTLEMSELSAAFQSNSRLLKAAIEGLEKSLLNATEHALKRSMAMVEHAIHEELGARGNPSLSHVGSRRGSTTLKKKGDSTKNWLLSHTRHGSSGHEDSATRRSSRENTRQGYEVTAKASKDSNTSDADRANSPKQEEDGTGSAQVEAIGERITRSRRRINTQELPRPMSRRAARNSLANNAFRFSAFQD